MTEDQEKLLKELYNRRALCQLCIQTVSEVSPEDSRREGALMEYNRQLGVIDGRIAEITGKPPAVVVGLKPAVLFPRSEGVGK